MRVNEARRREEEEGEWDAVGMHVSRGDEASSDKCRTCNTTLEEEPRFNSFIFPISDQKRKQWEVIAFVDHNIVSPGFPADWLSAAALISTLPAGLLPAHFILRFGVLLKSSIYLVFFAKKKKIPKE